MKLIFTFVITFISFALFAQEQIIVKLENRPCSEGVQPAFEIIVPQATSQEAIDFWKKTATPGGILKKKAKLEKVKDEWQFKNVLISDIQYTPIDVITQVSTFTGHIYVRFFMKNESGFIGGEGSSEELVDQASNFIRNYGVELYRLAVKKELDKEEKSLKSLEKDMKQLEKKGKDFDEKIAEAEQEKSLFSGQEKEKQELLKNSSGVIHELQKDELKNIKNQLKKARKSEAQAKKKLHKNKKEIKEVKHKINVQEQKVKEVHVKLDNIR